LRSFDTVNTYITKGAEVRREWLLIDASDQTLGRLASEIASILRGKHKVNYAPNLDLGDYVVVVNATKIVVSGNRLNDKMYRRHTGFPGGLRSKKARDLMKDDSPEILKKAVKGMLPKNKWQDKLISRLRVYSSSVHPHKAQKLENLEVI